MTHLISFLLYQDINEHIVNAQNELSTLQKKISHTKDLVYSADLNGNREASKNSKKFLR